MRLILIIILAILCPSAFSQVLNQDAEGKSSIVVPGGTLNLDVGQSLVKASFYKDSKAISGLLYGIDLQGKNHEGLAELFGGGNFSPNTEATGLIGGSHSWQGSTPEVAHRVLIYLRGGVSASEFRHDKGNTFTTIESRFANTQYVSPKIELGVTARLGGKWYFGLLYGRSKTNNFSDLRKTVYKYTINDSTFPGLQNSRDITAYSGDYGKYTNNYINFDALYFIVDNPVTAVNYVCPNLYFRLNTSNNQQLRQGNAVGGLSVNFISVGTGKFLGGVYVQTNDLFKQQSNAIHKTIQYGLVAKISFSTIAL